MLVYLMDECQYLNEINLPKEDVLGLKINDEFTINHKTYRIIKKKFYYDQDNSETYMYHVDFIVDEI